MPNHCCNALIMSTTTLTVVTNNYINKDEMGNLIFDFECVIPIGDVPDRYELRKEKWETRCIGYDVSIGADRIHFYTAWTPPIPILKKLAEIHKDFVFRLEYIEPCTRFQGKAVAKWQKQKVFINETCWDTNDESFDETEKATHINYQKLFDIWADFDDAEAPDEVMRLIGISDMGPIDAVSFTAFCYGYE